MKKPDDDYLVDTSVLVAWLRGETGIEPRAEMAGAAFLSVVVLGELHYGVEKSSRPEANRRQLIELVRGLDTVSIDPGTTTIYARLKAELRREGRKIPDNDLWIAATALQHEMVLVTRDSHFERIPDLSLERW